MQGSELDDILALARTDRSAAFEQVRARLQRADQVLARARLLRIALALACAPGLTERGLDLCRAFVSDESRRDLLAAAALLHLAAGRPEVAAAIHRALACPDGVISALDALRLLDGPGMSVSNEARAHMDLAAALREMGDPEGAAHEARLAVALAPDDPEVLRQSDSVRRGST